MANSHAAMLTVDLHNHTRCSHGRDTADVMAAAAHAEGMTVFGFSEHSPRPDAYRYPEDYGPKLKAGFCDFIADVRRLRGEYADRMEVLLAIEVDWFPEYLGAPPPMPQADYDYMIGSVHFLGTWGFDFTALDWRTLDREARFAAYDDYFAGLVAMIGSGHFQIAAHLDLIKIFSVNDFRVWIEDERGMRMVRETVAALADSGCALELSSAGLRKPCKEIYPHPRIIQEAAKLGVEIAVGSDAHRADHVGFGFDRLEALARRFGYSRSVSFKNRERRFHPF